ncbi:MAG: type II toxin-antitoxin system prevent-host-death family antitoxin [Bryobacteraceae bacterium]|jgi:prevent-host-death family protein
MTNQIAAGEFKAKCLQLLDEVQRSRKEILITKRGRPVARLLPVDQRAPAILGRMKGSVQILGDIIAPIDEKWNADE